MNSSALQNPSDPDATYRKNPVNCTEVIQLILKKQLVRMAL